MTLQADYEEAEHLYERATKIFEKSLGPDHPYVATSLNSRAELLRTQVRVEHKVQEC